MIEVEPTKNEANYLFEIKDPSETFKIIQQIKEISEFSQFEEDRSIR